MKDIPNFSSAHVLVVGDLMLDRYWHGDTSRISPEAPVPVVRVGEAEERPGGAGNVALNIAALGAEVTLLGLTGRDEACEALEKILQDTGRRRLFRIILIHHPPVPGVVTRRKRLADAAAFCSVVKRCGAELVLHGHIHRSSFKHINTARGNIPVISVPSALALGRKPERRAKYHIYHLKPAAQGWDVRLSVHGYSVEENRFIQEGEPQTIPIPRSG